MKRINSKQRELTGSAPKSHRELVKEAKENKTSGPKDKYQCNVYFNGSSKIQYVIMKPTKHKMKVAQLKHTHKHSDKIVKFSEIIPICKK